MREQGLMQAESFDYTNGEEKNKKEGSSLTNFKSETGSIKATIGSGQDAKNSISWITIRWCLTIGSGITLLLFISLWICYYLIYLNIDNKEMVQEIISLKEYIIKIWTIFTPILTLVLGYAYGHKQGEEKKADI